MERHRTGHSDSIEQRHRLPTSAPHKVIVSSRKTTPTASRVSPSNLHSIIGDSLNLDLSSPSNSISKRVTSNTRPSSENDADAVTKSALTRAELCRAMRSASIACSADEILFVIWFERLGLEKAINKAAKLNLQCLRPLHALVSKTQNKHIDMLKRLWYKSQYESPRHPNSRQSH
jgi:hypothetical protein